MNAVYNEIEPYACTWLERLIAAGHIAPGRVERRGIEYLVVTGMFAREPHRAAFAASTRSMFPCAFRKRYYHNLMTKDITITINASRYEDEDDCLTASAAEVSGICDIDRDMSPRWGDAERTTILLDVPANLRGADAIALVEWLEECEQEALRELVTLRNSVTLYKYDPTEGAHENISVSDARAIAAEDPIFESSLIWLSAS